MTCEKNALNRRYANVNTARQGREMLRVRRLNRGEPRKFALAQHAAGARRCSTGACRTTNQG